MVVTHLAQFQACAYDEIECPWEVVQAVVHRPLDTIFIKMPTFGLWPRWSEFEEVVRASCQPNCVARSV